MEAGEVLVRRACAMIRTAEFGPAHTALHAAADTLSADGNRAGPEVAILLGVWLDRIGRAFERAGIPRARVLGNSVTLRQLAAARSGSKRVSVFIDAVDAMFHLVLATEVAGQTLVERAESYIADNFRRDIHPSDVARRCRCSEGHLRRACKATRGYPISRIIRRSRVEYSKELLLRYPSWGIDAVAAECGFRRAAAFREAFKAETRMTPSEYRRRTAASSERTARDKVGRFLSAFASAAR